MLLQLLHLHSLMLGLLLLDKSLARPDTLALKGGLHQIHKVVMLSS
jgi:hypothetical protein